LYISDTGLTDTYSTVVGGRSCKPTPPFGWSRLSAPVELSAGYTTADIVLEIGSASTTVE